MVVANIKNGRQREVAARAVVKSTRLIPLFNSFNGPLRRTNYNYLPGNGPEIDLPNDNITDTRAENFEFSRVRGANETRSEIFHAPRIRKSLSI